MRSRLACWHLCILEANFGPANLVQFSKAAISWHSNFWKFQSVTFFSQQTTTTRDKAFNCTGVEWNTQYKKFATVRVGPFSNRNSKNLRAIRQAQILVAYLGAYFDITSLSLLLRFRFFCAFAYKRPNSLLIDECGRWNYKLRGDTVSISTSLPPVLELGAWLFHCSSCGGGDITGMTGASSFSCFLMSCHIMQSCTLRDLTGADLVRDLQQIIILIKWIGLANIKHGRFKTRFKTVLKHCFILNKIQSIQMFYIFGVCFFGEHREELISNLDSASYVKMSIFIKCHVKIKAWGITEIGTRYGMPSTGGLERFFNNGIHPLWF